MGALPTVNDIYAIVIPMEEEEWSITDYECSPFRGGDEELRMKKRENWWKR
jgi:hypothetical protein